jgi:3-phosphoshikimate 1-carboxyvinyltransferase
MGAEIWLEDHCDRCGEPVADLVIEPNRLRATEVTGPEVPAMIDEIPVLAVLAARAQGETRIRGATELRVKESDRLSALAANLRALGTHADELEDGLVIVGQEGPLAGRVETRGDHRIAMAFGVLAAQPGNTIEIDDPDAASVSYPGFWDDVRRTTASLLRA